MRRAREVYTHLAFKSAYLYFTLLDMHRITPMFRYSLQHFTRIFAKSIALSNRASGRSFKLKMESRSGSTIKKGKEIVS